MKLEICIALITEDLTRLDNMGCLAVYVDVGLRFLAFAGLNEFGRDSQLLQVSLLCFRVNLELLQKRRQCRLRQPTKLIVSSEHRSVALA